MVRWNTYVCDFILYSVYVYRAWVFLNYISV